MLTDRGFTGQIRDGSASGWKLYSFRSRYYNAATGRFLEPDTIVPDPKNPQALNRYAYTLDNPLKLVDPTGHSSMDRSWVSRWEAQHPGQGQPTQQDWNDYQFSLSHPGNGPQGSWSSSDWSLFGGIESHLGARFAQVAWPAVEREEALILAQARGDLPLRTPDCYTASFNVSIPNPATGTWLGPTFQLTLDRYKRWYVAVGLSFGKSPLLASGSVVGGWLLQGDPAKPGPLESFITSWSVNVSGGFVVGGGVTWGNPGSFNPNDFSAELGLFYPWQSGATVSYGWELS